MRKIMGLSLFMLMLGGSVALADDAGQAVYDKSCKSCHGADGSGNADKAKALKVEADKLNLLGAATAGASKDDVKKIITDGKDKMPAYGKKLKPEEVDAVADFTVGLKKAKK